MSPEEPQKPKRLVIKKASERDLCSVYVILERYYGSLMRNGEDFCRNHYSKNIQEMVAKNDSRILLCDGEPIATFTLCESPLGDIAKSWDTQKALYLEGYGFLPVMRNEKRENLLCSNIERIALAKGHDILRVAALDRIAEFYKNQGYDHVNKRLLESGHNFILLEKRLGEAE